MKIFRNCILVGAFSIFSINLAFAQSATFTVLPGTDKSWTMEDCQALLDHYMIDQKMPSTADVQNAQDELNTAKDNLESAKKALAALKSPLQCNVGDTVCQKENAKAYAANQCNVGDTVCQEENMKAIESAQILVNSNQAYYDSKAGATDANPEAIAGLRQNLLGCAIKTGRITLSMAPYYVTYLINFALGLVGLVALLFIVIGGYHYVLGGLGEDKEKGKNTIKNALIGMAVALLAWSAINVLIQALTG